MRMTSEEFDRELQYQTITYFIKKMLSEGLITEEEFHRIDEANRQKYQPITGSLLSHKSLICVSIRANICADKEEIADEKDPEN